MASEEKKSKGKSRISFLVRTLGIVAFVYILCRISLVILNLLALDYAWIAKFDLVCDYVVIGVFGILAFFWAISGSKNFILKIVLLIIIGVAVAFLLGFIPSVREWIAGLSNSSIVR